MASISDILNDLNINFEAKGKSFVLPCLFHEERTPSFYIDGESGVCHCFSCDVGMTFIQFVQTVTDLDRASALSYLYTKGNLGSDSKGPGISRSQFSSYTRRNSRESTDLKIVSVNEPLHIPASRHPYRIERGLSIEEVSKYKISIVKDPRYEFRMYNNWMYFPIYKDGALRTYFMRETNGSGKIYGYYKDKPEGSNEQINVGYPRKDILYNIDNCADKKSPVAVSEGIIDSIFVSRVCPQSMASLSNRFLPEQIESLAGYEIIYIFPDNDKTEAGLQLVKSIIPHMWKFKIMIAQLPFNKKDAATCSVKELQAAYDNAIPLQEFILSKRYLNFLDIISKKRVKKA